MHIGIEVDQRVMRGIHQPIRFTAGRQYSHVHTAALGREELWVQLDVLNVIIARDRPKSGRGLSSFSPHHRRLFTHSAIIVERLPAGPRVG